MQKVEKIKNEEGKENHRTSRKCRQRIENEENLNNHIKLKQSQQVQKIRTSKIIKVRRSLNIMKIQTSIENEEPHTK